MTNLDVLLLRGSKAGDPAVNLEELRYEVLVNGIPSKTDGMVSPTLRKQFLQLKIYLLRQPQLP